MLNRFVCLFLTSQKYCLLTNTDSDVKLTYLLLDRWYTRIYFFLFLSRFYIYNCFWQFGYNVPSCRCLCIYFTWTFEILVYIHIYNLFMKLLVITASNVISAIFSFSSCRIPALCILVCMMMAYWPLGSFIFLYCFVSFLLLRLDNLCWHVDRLADCFFSN